MYRRDFMFACAASALAASLPATPADASPRFYARARLIDPSGRRLKAHELPANRNFIFHYPFAGTPCFLLNLGRPTKVWAQLKTADEQTYEWPGGVGADHSIVAYSAICAHRLAYPPREISFISYRNETSPGSKFAHAIHCRSEHSQYDPAEGARVLAGPRPFPLALGPLDHYPRHHAPRRGRTPRGGLFHQGFEQYDIRLARPPRRS